MIKIFSLSSFLLCISCSVNAGSFVLQDYNVVTIKDFETSSHVDGKVFVGGDLIANDKIGINEHPTSPYSDASLQVSGYVDAAKGISVHGTMEVGDTNTVTNIDKLRVNGYEIQNSDGASINSDLTSIASNYKNELEQASITFKNLQSNSTVSYSDSKKTTLQVDESLSAGDYAVFDLDNMNKFFSATPNQEAEILANNISDIAGIIINVGGTTIEQANNNGLISSPSFLANFNNKILWNFYEATTIATSTRDFVGTLLAPLATVSLFGNVEGSVGAFSLIAGQREIHFTGSEITPTSSTVQVNEPTTLILFAIALMAFARRFTRR